MGVENAFFVDSGVSYSNATPFRKLGGLWHLEGQQVVVLADGVELDPLTVEHGYVTLPAPVNAAHVGLAYVSDMQLLPASMERIAAFGQMSKANINKVVLRMRSSGPVMVGPNFTYMNETWPIVGADPDELQTGRVEINIEPTWGDDAQPCVRQTHPLPVEILSIALDVAVGG